MWVNTCTSLTLRKNVLLLLFVNLQNLLFQLQLLRNVTKESPISTSVCPKLYKMSSLSWLNRWKNIICPVLSPSSSRHQAPNRVSRFGVVPSNSRTTEFTVVPKSTVPKLSEWYLFCVKKKRIFAA
jgi:hypothetical protein